MTRLALLLVLLSLPALAAEPAELAKPAEPTALSQQEQLSLLKLQNELNRLTSLAQKARAEVAELVPKIQDADARLQALARSLQQKHGAVGYNLDSDLQWVASSPQSQPLGAIREDRANAPSDQP